MRLALDTNVLLDLAENVSDIVRLFEASKKKGYSLTVSWTVAGELFAASDDATDLKRQVLADKVLDELLTKWGVVPMPEPCRLEDAENFSHMLRTRKLLPMEERNDGLIIAECSLEGVGVLITRDKHLLSDKMDTSALRLAFSDSRFPTEVAIIRPVRMANILRRLPDAK